MSLRAAAPRVASAERGFDRQHAPEPAPCNATTPLVRSIASAPFARQKAGQAPRACGFGLHDMDIGMPPTPPPSQEKSLPVRARAPPSPLQPRAVQAIGGYVSLPLHSDDKNTRKNDFDVIAVFSDSEGDGFHWNSCMAASNAVVSGLQANTSCLIFNGDLTDIGKEYTEMYDQYEKTSNSTNGPFTQVRCTWGNRDVNKLRLLPDVEIPSPHTINFHRPGITTATSLKLKNLYFDVMTNDGAADSGTKAIKPEYSSFIHSEFWRTKVLESMAGHGEDDKIRTRTNLALLKACMSLAYNFGARDLANKIMAPYIHKLSVSHLLPEIHPNVEQNKTIVTSFLQEHGDDSEEKFEGTQKHFLENI